MQVSRPSPRRIVLYRNGETTQKEAQRRINPVHQYFICDAYPPSTKAISELGHICIPELQLDTHHYGKVLFIRTMCVLLHSVPLF